MFYQNDSPKLYRPKIGLQKFRMAILFDNAPISIKVTIFLLIILMLFTISTMAKLNLKKDRFVTACIVLGEMLVNGEASKNLEARIQATQNALAEFLVSDVIISGGDTAQVNKTEAYVMKQLWDQSIYESKKFRFLRGVHLEQQSISTCQNALFSIPILKKIKVDRIVLVTSDYHIPRAKLIFEQVFSTDAAELLNTQVFTYAAPTTLNDDRTHLFENERFWLQPDRLKLLLTNMTDHPFDLPSKARIEKARRELDDIEQQFS
jgi:uncharacterized SAM-binding protein YcdF (DUF218 family)